MFGLSFLSPWFLLGLAAAAGPLLLHLFARENAPLTLLPTMRFVPRAPVEQTRRRRLQDLWLLLLRVAALALLAVAFARPFFARPAAATQASLGIVAIDTSFSMAGRDREQATRALARQALDGMPSGLPVALMTFDQEARLVVAPTASRSEIAATIDRTTAGYGSTNIGAAVRGALDVARGRPARVVLVTDGQRGGADAEALPLIPQGFDIAVAAVPPKADNVAIDSLARIDNEIVARVRAYGGGERRTRLRWALDGRPLGEEVVTVPVGNAVEGRLSRSLPTRGVVTATVDDEGGYAADNDRTLVLDPPGPLAVTVITSVDGPPDEALYVRAALDAAGAERRPFAVTPVPANDARLADTAFLAASRVIIVTGTRGLERAARAAIAASARDGRGLLLTAGPNVEPGVIRDLLGGVSEIGDGAALDGGPQGLVSTEVRHPVLSALGETAGNLGQVRVDRGWAMREPASGVVLLRYASGRPALMELELGKGRALLLTTDLSRRWNTWPVHPTFVPMLTEAVRHLSGDRPLARDVLVDTAAGPAWAKPGIVTATGATERVAVNVDPRESDVDVVPAAELLGRFERLPGTPDPARAERETEQAQALWRASLLALLAVLVVEGLMAARPRGRQPAPVMAAAGEASGGRER